VSLHNWLRAALKLVLLNPRRTHITYRVTDLNTEPVTKRKKHTR